MDISGAEYYTPGRSPTSNAGRRLGSHFPLPHLTHRYRIAGLTIGADMPFPGVDPCADPTAACDVVARVTSIPAWDMVPDPEDPTAAPRYTVDPTRFRMAVPQVGRFAALDGTQLHMHPDPDVPHSAAVTYLLGTTFAALLYQRGGLVLHGAAVALEGRAHLLLGPSGRGKSTLSATLCTLGCQLLCDDMARIEEHQGTWLVYADHRRTKLHDATIAALGLEHAAGDRVGDTSGKRFVALPRAPQDWLPLGSILALAVDPAATAPSHAPLAPLAAAALLLRRTYRGAIHRALVPGTRTVQWTSALVQDPGVLQVVRPATLDTVHATAQLVHRTISGA